MNKVYLSGVADHGNGPYPGKMGERRHPTKIDEWRVFYQKLALGLMSLCGAMSTFMIYRFLGQFDSLAQNVAGMQSSVSDLNNSLKETLLMQNNLKIEQQNQRREIDAMKRKNLGY